MAKKRPSPKPPGSSPKDIAESTETKAPAPPRITPGGALPLRYKLRTVKLFQDYAAKQSAPAAPRTPSSYRKKRERGDALPSERHLAFPRGSLLGGLEAYHYKPPTMIVDGYNIINAWPKLKKWFVRGDLDVAREKLNVDLAAYGTFRGFNVTVVFDASESGLGNHSEGEGSFKVAFAGKDTADSWIEKEVSRLQAEGQPKVWVATDDMLLQNMASSMDAHVWPSKILIQEIKAARKEMLEAMKEERPFSFAGKQLVDGLPEDLRQELSEWKQNLRVGPPAAYRAPSSDSDSESDRE